MGKPGQSSNLSSPALSERAAIGNVGSIASGSRQTPETAQRSMDANRLAPRRGPSGPSGSAAVEVSGVMDQQGRMNDTAATNYNYGRRKKIFSGL